MERAGHGTVNQCSIQTGPHVEKKVQSVKIPHGPTSISTQSMRKGQSMQISTKLGLTSGHRGT